MRVGDSDAPRAWHLERGVRLLVGNRGARVGPDAGFDRGDHPRRMKARAPNHGAYSGFVRSLVDGPCRHVPVALNREPWHGQSQVVSAALNRTWQPRCVQRVEIAWSMPWSSR